jgi:hypothetical protein
MSMDQQQLSTRNSVTTMGIKVMDPAGRDPKDGGLLYGSLDHNNVQSRNHCFPIQMVCQGESKEVIKEFEPSIEEIMGWNDVAIEDGYEPFEIKVNSDLACIQKIVDKGGTYKQKIFGCHLCAEHRDRIGIQHGVNVTSCVQNYMVMIPIGNVFTIHY